MLVVNGNEVPPGKFPLHWDKDTTLWSLGDQIKTGAPNKKTQAATEFLLEYLKDGRHYYQEIKELVVDEGICSRRTLMAVKKELGIISDGKGKHTTWALPKKKLKFKSASGVQKR